MKKFALITIALFTIVLMGCAEEEEEPSLDKNLIGAWAYNDSDEVLVLEFFEPKDYKFYYILVFSDNTYCDIYAYGKATTSGGAITYKREGGLVANTACLNYIAGGSEDGAQTYSQSGQSLILGDPGSSLILASTTVDSWADPMYGDSIAYLRGDDNIRFDNLIGGDK